MRIVVLDGYTLNPGDLSWRDMEALGQVTVYDRTAPGETVERAKGAEAVLTNKVVLSREVIAELADLRYIGVLATGYNVVDVEAARERGVTVTNVPAYSTDSVAQMVFAHILNLTHHAAGHARGVSEGRWSRSRDFAYWEWPLVELSGLTMGVVGYGQIGRAVARIARAFGMKVIVHTPHPPKGGTGATGEGVEFVELDALFSRGDVVTIHSPLTDATRAMVNAERLARMKPTAFLINTSRGPVIDEAALAGALRRGEIAGAGLDVLSTEPPALDNPLLSAPNCYITPHIAWATLAARTRLLAAAAGNLRAFIDGRPRNVVN